MSEDVRALCKRRYGDRLCVVVYAADYRSVVATHECRIEEEIEPTEGSEP